MTSPRNPLFSSAILVLAKAVQDRLGENFYDFADTHHLSLHRGLLIDGQGEVGFVDELDRIGFLREQDYGIALPGSPRLVCCAGISYPSLFGDDGLSAKEPWTEDDLPEPIRAARQELLLVRERASLAIEQAKLDTECQLARDDGIPESIVVWARRQPHALYEINGVRLSVLHLRAAGTPEPRIAAALASPRFLQELFTLKRTLGLSEFPLQAITWLRTGNR